ncbi:hypothetical protein BDP27DRAFT_1190245, partial [Rhodocollybia butyracea]
STNISATAKAYGTVCALILLKSKSLPSTISPALFQALFQGSSSVDDRDWISYFHQSAYEVISDWP